MKGTIITIVIGIILFIVAIILIALGFNANDEAGKRELTAGIIIMGIGFAAFMLAFAISYISRQRKINNVQEFA